MRRSPHPGSATSPHKHTPNFYSDDSHSSMSATSGESSGPRSTGPGPVEPDGRKARGSSCGEPALSPGVPEGTTWAGSPRQKLAPQSHTGTAGGAATVRGGASEPTGSSVVSEEHFDLLSTMPEIQEMTPPQLSKSLLRDMLVNVYREVSSVRFLITVVSLLGVFLAVIWCGLLYLIPPLENEPKEILTLSQYHERVRSQGQQLEQLQAELDKLHKEVSSVRAANSERVAELVFQRLHEDFVRKPDYALSSVGASIDLEKTSQDYVDTDTGYFWNHFSLWNYARPPTVILEPEVFPGNCWAFEGDQGQVVIRLPGRVQLSDITLQHPPHSVAHTGGADSAPRDFTVYGIEADDETEVFLGNFTFEVEKSEIQTFHLQNDPPAAFPKVKIQILSNWGHPHFTCLYRVRAHGLKTTEETGDSAPGDLH